MGKRIKKVTLWLLAMVMVLTMSVPVCAQTTQVPVSKELGNLSVQWQKQFGKGAAGGPGAAAATPPIAEGEYVYIGYQQYVYKLDKSTGETVKKSAALGGDMGFATQPVTYDNGYLYLALRVVKVVAGENTDFTKVAKVDAETLEICWVSKEYKGQNTCPVFVTGGRCYTGTWEEPGQYICLNSMTGTAEWTLKSSEGFYWDGAEKVTVGGTSYVTFAADNGEIFTIPTNATQEEVDQIQPEKVDSKRGFGVLRSTPAVTMQEDGAEVVVPTITGDFAIVTISADGKTNLKTMQGSFSSTNNPVVVKNQNGTTVFFGTESGELYQYRAGSKEAPKLVNKQGTTVPARAPGKIKGEMLASSPESGSEVTLFATYNSKPGGIWLADLSWNGSEYEAKTCGETFRPQFSQYCISPMNCDAEGNLYYKNDAGYVYSVKPGIDTSAVTNLSVEATSYSKVSLRWMAATNATAYVVERSTDGKTFSAVKTVSDTATTNTVNTGTKYYYRVKAKLIGGAVTATSSVKTVKTSLATPKATSSRGSGKIKVTASKVSGASGYVFYRSTKKTSGFKAVKTSTSRTWTNSKLKHKKTYYYRVRAFRKVGSKRVYSNYSNTTYKTTK